MKNRIVWWLELVLKLGMLTVGFLEASSLTFGKPVISAVLWPTVCLGGLVFVLRLTQLKSYRKSWNFWFLIAFCVSCLLSSVLNLQYGWYQSIRTLIWMVFLMFAVYCYREDRGRRYYELQYDICSIFYLVCAAVLSLISFWLLAVGYSKVFFPEEGPIYYLGFRWGRLYGAYWDANIGAVMCCVSILISMGFLTRKKGTVIRLLLTANIVLEVMYITFSDSRTGRLCLGIAVPLYVLLGLLRKKKAAVVAAWTLTGLLAAGGAPVIIKQVYNEVSVQETVSGEKETQQSVGSSAEKSSFSGQNNASGSSRTASGQTAAATETQLGREEEYAGDVTNRRADIWKSAVEIFLTAPAVGIGHNNVLAYTEENLPDSYLITNDHMKFDSMHNIFFDVLVGQGMIGLLLFLVTGISFLYLIFKNRQQIREHSNGMYICQFGILAVLAAAGCVMTEIVYVMSPMSTMFWFSLGCLGKAAEKTDHIEKESRGMLCRKY